MLLLFLWPRVQAVEESKKKSAATSVNIPPRVLSDQKLEAGKGTNCLLLPYWQLRYPKTWVLKLSFSHGTSLDKQDKMLH